MADQIVRITEPAGCERCGHLSQRWCQYRERWICDGCPPLPAPPRMPALRRVARIAMLVFVALVSCGPLPHVDLATNAANAARLTQDAVTVERGQECERNYVAAMDLERPARIAVVANLDAYCVPLRTALDEYDAARRALSLAVLAVHLGHANADALLADREGRLAAASARLGVALAGGR